MRKLHLAVVLCVCALTSVAVQAQKGMGRLNGKVVDEGGATLDGVIISFVLARMSSRARATRRASGYWPASRAAIGS